MYKNNKTTDWSCRTLRMRFQLQSTHSWQRWVTTFRRESHCIEKHVQSWGCRKSQTGKRDGLYFFLRAPPMPATPALVRPSGAHAHPAPKLRFVCENLADSTKLGFTNWCVGACITRTSLLPRTSLGQDIHGEIRDHLRLSSGRPIRV